MKQGRNFLFQVWIFIPQRTGNLNFDFRLWPEMDK